MRGIRKATIKDAPLIAEINEKSEDPVDKKLRITKNWVKRHIKDITKNKKTDAFVYEDKGCIILKKEFAGFNNCEIYWLTVDKRYQNRGIGTKLVKFIEKFAKKSNFRGIYAYTHEMHKEAIKFYKKQGYRKINKFPNYYSNGDTSILFGKMLK